MNAKSRVGLWKITAEVFENFCITAKIFKKHTERCSNQIDGKLITKAVLEDAGVLGNFSKLNSNINYVGNEIAKNFLKASIICANRSDSFHLLEVKWVPISFGRSKPGHLEQQ